MTGPARAHEGPARAFAADVEPGLHHRVDEARPPRERRVPAKTIRMKANGAPMTLQPKRAFLAVLIGR